MNFYWDLGLLTYILNVLIQFLSNENIDFALKILQALLAPTICIYGILVLLDKADANPFFKAITIATYIYVIQNYALITDGLFDLFSRAGIAIGGGTNEVDSDLLLDPSKLLSEGISLISDIWELDDLWDLLIIIDFDERVFTSLIMFLYFCFLALSDIFYVFEYHVVLTFSLILYPFGILGKPFTFLSESLVTNLFRFNVRIMIFSFFLSINFTVFEGIMDKFSSYPSSIECGALFISTIAMGFLSFKIPGIASTIITGHSNFSFNSMITSATIIATAAATKGASLISKITPRK